MELGEKFYFLKNYSLFKIPFLFGFEGLTDFLAII